MDLFTVPPEGGQVPAGCFAWASHLAVEPARFSAFPGQAFGGSFDEAAEWMRACTPHTTAWIVIFRRGTGMEKFLADLPPEVAAIPMAGGATARDAGCDEGYAVPSGGDVAVFALREGKWESLALHAHAPTGKAFTCSGPAPRQIAWVESDGQRFPADEFFAAERRAHGLAKDDWDRLALISESGVMIHLHDAGDGLVGCGTNLPESGRFRIAVFDEERGRQVLTEALSPGALLFGCAGLHGLFQNGRPWEREFPSTYLYGEVASMAGCPGFSNLTFSILRPQ